MKPITDIVKQIGVTTLVIVLLVLVVIGIVGFFIWRRRSKGETAGVEVSPPKEEKVLKKRALRAVWRGLLRRQRPEYRRIIPTFQPLVFLGTHTVDSARLISAYNEWQRLEEQGRYSETKHTDLHLYVGATSVVHDILPHILEDGSSEAQTALQVLWEDTHHKRDPIAIVGVSWKQLVQAQAADISMWANQVRGKVNRLAFASDKPVDVRVALTSLSSLPGYDTFSRFAIEADIELVLCPEKADAEGLRQSFSELARFGELALTKLTADEYRRAMLFLEEAPKHLSRLALFLEALLDADALSKTPMLSGIYFVNNEGTGANPLQFDASKLKSPKHGPNWRHKLGTAAAAAFFVTILGLLWIQERHSWLKASAAASSYRLIEETALAQQPDGHKRHTYRKFFENSENLMRRQEVGTFVAGSRSQGWIPEFYGNAIPKIQDTFSSRVRETAFHGLIQETIREHPLPHQRVLYLLALTHACRGDESMDANTLYNFAWKHTSSWSKELGLPEELLQQYLDWSRSGERHPVPLQGLEDGRDSGSRLQGLWRRHFEELADIAKQKNLDRIRLNKLKKNNGILRNSLVQSNRFPEASKIVRMLEHSCACSGTGARDCAQQETSRQVSPWWSAYEAKFTGIEPVLEFQHELRGKDGMLTQVLDVVDQSRLVPKEVDKVVDPKAAAALSSLMRNLSLIEQGATLPAELPELVRVQGKWYDFDVSNWAAAVKHNGYRRAIERFLDANPEADPTLIFFGAADSRELGRCHVMLNSGARGEDFFTGKAEVPCEYTRKGFKKFVVEQLQKLNSLEVVSGAGGKSYGPLYARLKQHLERALARYAREYRGHWLTYFERFGMRATSVEQLQILLRRLESPSSPLQEMIDNLRQNVSIEAPKELQGFIDPVQEALNVEFRPVLSFQMKDYQAFVTALRETLEVEQPAADAKADASALESSETLEVALGPAGKVALASLRGDPGSQRKLVRKWLRETNIDRYGNNPFDDPFNEVNKLGARNLRSTLRTAWRTSFEVEVAPVFQKFPFNTRVSQEVEPEELSRLFKPETGLFFSLVRRYILPVSRKDPDRGYGPLNTRMARAKLVPGKVYRTINNIAALSQTLWDDKGTPQSYVVPVYGEPLPVGNPTRAVLSLAYLREGDRSLVNFNQAKIAARRVLEIDWNTPSVAQVGLRLTDVETKEDIYPRAMASDKKYWSLLHLLRRRRKLTATEASKLPRLPVGHKRYAFRFILGSSQGGGSLTASFVAERDPFLPFRRLAYSGSIWE